LRGASPFGHSGSGSSRSRSICIWNELPARVLEHGAQHGVVALDEAPHHGRAPLAPDPLRFVEEPRRGGGVERPDVGGEATAFLQLDVEVSVALGDAELQVLLGEPIADLLLAQLRRAEGSKRVLVDQRPDRRCLVDRGTADFDGHASSSSVTTATIPGRSRPVAASTNERTARRYPAGLRAAA
jgi:hypothetical protein